MSEKTIYILCIETATEMLSIALSKNGECIYSYIESEKQSHAKNITLAIQQCMDETKISFQELAAVAINQGPGSFTGLRVASSTAKGLCFALKIPFIAIDGLKEHCIALQKQQFPSQNCFLLLDARRNNFYYTYCDTNGNSIIDSTFDSFENIENIANNIGNSSLVKNTDFQEIPILNAKNMCEKAYIIFLASDFKDIRLFEPNYIINNYVKTNL
jgi:tRNA threonylcarbamoyladenosine biosynthesis protein TsaB